MVFKQKGLIGFHAYTFAFFLGSGARLKDIGDLYGISQSGVKGSCDRLEIRLGKDKHLEEELLQLAENLKKSKV